MVAGNVLERVHGTAEVRAGLLFIFSLVFIPFAWYRFNVVIALVITVALPIVCRRLAAGGRCPPIKSQAGKVVVITGANTGIGKETAIVLAERGAKVIIACRDSKRGLDAATDIRKAARLDVGSKQVELMLLDVSDLDSVRRFVDEFKAKRSPLHALINNAGIMMTPHGLTKQGHELQFGTNHLGHFLLTTLLLDEIKENKTRVINVASLAHTFPGSNKSDVKKVAELNVLDKTKYNPKKSYGYTKLANIWFTTELQKRLGDSGASAYVLHPGSVQTEILRSVPILGWLSNTSLYHWATSLVLKSLPEGAQTTLYCATQPTAIPGEYHSDCRLTPTTALADSPDKATELWEYSEQLIRN